MMRHALLLALLGLMPACEIAAQNASPATVDAAQAAIYKHSISGFDPGDARAPDVVKLLNDQFPSLIFSAEPTTNRIYARVPKEQVNDIESLIHELARVAAEHKQQQERMRQEQMDKEAYLKAKQSSNDAPVFNFDVGFPDERGRSGAILPDSVAAGSTFSMPLGLRLAQTQLRNAELKRQKLLATHGPNHSEVRNVELEIEAIKHLQKPQFQLFDQYQTERFSPRKIEPMVEQPAQLAEILKQIRPDLDVQVEGIVEGQIILRGSETAVAEAERVIKALQAVTRSSDPATLQQQYENAERSAANLAEQLRQSKSASNSDKERVTELRNHLTAAVELAFELRLQLQQYQLERAEADLMTARVRLIRREQIAEQIIKRRIEELENDDDSAWTPRRSSSFRPNDSATEPDDLKPGSPQKQTTQQPTDDGNAWQRVFGIKLGPVADLSEYKTSYRGGIRITSVLADSSAQKAGIKSGDILVGIGVWETVSQENLAFVFDKVFNSSDKNPVKFYILRKGETIWGHIDIPDLATTEASGDF